MTDSIRWASNLKLRRRNFLADMSPWSPGRWFNYESSLHLRPLGIRVEEIREELVDSTTLGTLYIIVIWPICTWMVIICHEVLYAWIVICEYAFVNILIGNEFPLLISLHLPFYISHIVCKCLQWNRNGCNSLTMATGRV